MDEPILVRVYDVGFGDCIYVRIPDGDGRFHLLIDCGTSGSTKVLEAALGDVREMLPLEDGKRRLDLLVVTHPHADHISGFNPNWFEGIQIRRIWLSVFMNSAHPEAKKALAFQAMAGRQAKALLGRGLALAPGMEALLEMCAWNVRNETALPALREGLAQSSSIYPRYPLYVARDLTGTPAADRRQEYDLDLDQGITRFRGFREPGTCLQVLAPEWDIDKYYLGRGSFAGSALVDQHLLCTEAYGASAETPGRAEPSAVAGEGAPAAPAPRPGNISDQDFRLLRNRLLYAGLAFSQEDKALKNNTSVVLLLEWRGRRLLFAGDAEWQGAGVEEERRNSTWDVMLHIPEVRQHLLQPLHFLKVAHHGSHNGTPFLKGGKAQVLEKILSPDRSQVAVSTVTGVHGEDMPVPYAPLLEALGRLAANKRRYPHAPEPELRNVDQPQRTDLEPPVPGKQVRYTEVTLEGADG
jgi:beta-lactamase superfamily II metal-dependent hydrolase